MDQIPRDDDQAIVLDGVTKRFGSFCAVDDVSFQIREGEFFSMLGPSGCGKTTTLRMIAGFEELSGGRILLRENDVTHVPPARRNVNMVFQSYALFPHMTVWDNVAFGLQVKRVRGAALKDRVTAALGSVQLEGFEKRKPGQLSGGQQQRVALARALVNEPAALLLDEPLGALDLKLRKELQHELKSIQVRTKTTFVYVTHDQEEALTMSDRIAVMNKGVVEQMGTPRELYEHPATAFVAGFIGPSNLIRLAPGERAGDLGVMRLADGQRIVARCDGLDEQQLTVRPEKIVIANDDPGPRWSHVAGTVEDVVYLGSMTQLLVDIPTGERLVVHQLNNSTSPENVSIGDTVMLNWAAEHSFVIQQGAQPADTE